LSTHVASRAAGGLPWDRADLERALALEDFDVRTQPYLRASGVAAVVAIFDDDIQGAEASLMRLVEMGVAAGPSGDYFWTELFLAYCRSRLGTLSADQTPTLEWDVFSWSGSLLNLLVRALKGTESLGEISPLITSAAESSAAAATVMITVFGAIMIADDRQEELVETTAPIFQMLLAMEVREPLIIVWGTDLAEAHLGLADAESAAAVVTELERLDAAMPRRSLRAGLSRVEALRLGQAGELDAAVELATTSIDLYAELGWPVELGRSLLVRAHLAHRRRASRDALDDARRAAELFATADSLPWTRKADAAIERFSRRSRTSEGRTATEERVAELVRLGLSNAEIAARLHISVKTVESHLTRIYRDAGVKSRAAFQALTSPGSDTE
jgi:DNA-binding CsgD family transcriptional regulator